jgi:hypothetical protein
VEIFYCGSLEGGRVARILTDVLWTMPRGEIDEDIGNGHPHERARSLSRAM